MLTLDLVRIRRSKGEILPRYIKKLDKLLPKAEQLIELYKEHIDRTRGELDETIRDIIGDGTDFLVLRGLSKLLSDRSEFTMQAPIDPRELRREIFERAAKAHPVTLHPDLHHRVNREQLLQEVADVFELTLAQVEAALYADLQDAYVLTAFDEIGPEALLHRYNLALAQAVLFRARSMHIDLFNANAKRLRQLMRFIKFFRLIASVIPIDGGYRFAIDGPMSIFRFCQKYGLQMANFLPALLLCEDWQMEAELLWDGKNDLCHFKLTSDSLLQSHFPDKGVYVTEEEKYFRKRWKDFDLEWELKPKTKIIRLGAQQVTISDYELAHPDGREVLLEFVGFWHRQSLLSKLKAIQEHDIQNLILIAPARLRVSENDLPQSDAAVYFFKDVVLPKRVVALAETLTS